MRHNNKFLIALAGQPNGGKSTVFNSLTGAKQLVANYPGVTVDKMTGWYKKDGVSYEVVDLPGTYSLTSYSPEERVSRNFLISEQPSVVVNVVDTSNLKRCLYLTFQLMEMGLPTIVDLNMMDVADKNGIKVDPSALSNAIGIPVVGTSIRTGQGREELLSAISDAANGTSRFAPVIPGYPDLASQIETLKEQIEMEPALARAPASTWLAIKLMENDEGAIRIVREAAEGAGKESDILRTALELREAFEREHEQEADMYIASCRYKFAGEVAASCTKRKEGSEGASFSNRIDRVVCGKITGPIVLLCVVYLLYHLSIVEGYKVTNYTWPILAGIRGFFASILPSPGFISIPVLRELVLWCVDSVNALLNYIPIFFILFGLIAIMEDSGYMPRMAFIMDRLLNRYGLHGQSTLSMVLSGVVVGGCIVPGVMSTKGIPDERSRLATILTLPMLNCLAKVPLYILLINVYFSEYKSSAMFFVSTISLLFVLPVAKLLTMTVLRNKPTAPFIMEMPPYHVPTIRGVIGRAIERVWLYIRKITTVVVAVSVVLFAMLQFPGIPQESIADYEERKDAAVSAFIKQISKTSYAERLKTEGEVLSLILYQEDYRNARRKAAGKMEPVDEKFRARDEAFYSITTDKKDKDGQTVDRALKKVVSQRRDILSEMREERIETSVLGKTGRALEPASKYAGFNWRVNVSILSALAAKENTVATLGALYQLPEQDEGGEAENPQDTSLESRMSEQETGFTSLHALALMLFMILCPPCIPTAIAIKVQTGSFKWMLFSLLYPLILGLVMATLIFTGGSALGLDGTQAMWVFYFAVFTLTVLLGFLGKDKDSIG